MDQNEDGDDEGSDVEDINLHEEDMQEANRKRQVPKGKAKASRKAATTATPTSRGKRPASTGGSTKRAKAEKKDDDENGKGSGSKFKKSHMSFRDASVSVLKMMRKPMSAKDISNEILKHDLVKSSGKTPDRTVAGLIYQEINRKKAKSAFILVTKGYFGLKDFSEAEKSNVDTSSSAKRRSSSSSPREAATTRAKRSRSSKWKRKSYQSDEEEEESTEEETESEDNHESDDERKKNNTAIPKRRAGAGKAPRNSPLVRLDTQHSGGRMAQRIKTSTSPLETSLASPIAISLSSSGSRNAPVSPVTSDNSKESVEKPYSTKLQQQFSPTRAHMLKPRKPPRIDMENYDDDYGYVYLRYFLDISRREDEGDLSHEDDCFVCKHGGDLICCDYPNCPKVYHSSCVDKSTVPQEKWYCPWHSCMTCREEGHRVRSTHSCATCTLACCDKHLPTEGQGQVKHIKDGFIICKDCKIYFMRELEME